MQEKNLKCRKCKSIFSEEDLKQSYYVCPRCDANIPIDAVKRIEMITDVDSFNPYYEEVRSKNPFHNLEYVEKIQKLENELEVTEAISVGKARIRGNEVIIGVCNTSFFMGSMGYAMGERVARAFEYAIRHKLPVILYCCSGGARMQEGLISLMQMEKTAAAVKRHSMAGLFFCSVLTDPTLGGVTASFATLGDVILAEPKATIGFAGKRVIEQTIGKKLSDDVQTAEYQLKNGLVDMIVNREEQRDCLAFLLHVHSRKFSYRQFSHKKKYKNDESAISDKKLNDELTAWKKVKEARKIDRPSAMDYINLIFDKFMEFHGDHLYGDDRALIGGIALLNGNPVTVIATLKGNEMQECVERNFGMSEPEGYRKALRLMKQAEKFKRPIIAFVNTAGAYCGLDAEMRGQGIAIAKNLSEMSNLEVPVLSILIGEGGSGGALAIAVGNEVWMLENATYSVISPEGYAAILWKDSNMADKAADIMGITGKELYQLKIIEKIIPEFGGASGENVALIAQEMKRLILVFLKEKGRLEGKKLAKERYNRFRKF